MKLKLFFVAVLILIWGIHGGWDEYATDQLRSMGPRGVEGLEFFSAFFVKRNWELNLPRMLLMIIRS